VKKHNFDQTPKLLETFDQLIRSSEIRSTDPLSFKHFNLSTILCAVKSQLFIQNKKAKKNTNYCNSSGS
jgi:hypothetical protein